LNGRRREIAFWPAVKSRRTSREEARGGRFPHFPFWWRFILLGSFPPPLATFVLPTFCIVSSGPKGISKIHKINTCLTPFVWTNK
jgi:hypothetical protein